MPQFSFELIDTDGKLIEVTSSPADSIEEAERLGRRLIAARIKALRIALIRIRESASGSVLATCR